MSNEQPPLKSFYMNYSQTYHFFSYVVHSYTCGLTIAISVLNTFIIPSIFVCSPSHLQCISYTEVSSSIDFSIPLWPILNFVLINFY